MIEPGWDSLPAFAVPRWLRDAKFGIYTHWGVYSVPACGPNATWYAYNMYREGSLQNYHHRLHYGDPARFGYKDFVPLFTAERFDPDDWAELFRRSGAKFAGPVGEHHDGFSMWNTRHSPWNAAAMGPHRDVVGELAASLRRQGLKFMVAMHHAEHWWFYPHWKKGYDVADPRWADFYGEIHDAEWAEEAARLDPDPYVLNHHEFWPRQSRPSKAFLDRWLAKLLELNDAYEPDLVWFDFALKWVQEHYKLEFASRYYEACARRGTGGAITFKWNDMAVGSGVEDIEQGKRADLAHNFWVTDTTIDDGEAWGYIDRGGYKSVATLVHYLVDNVSKNGALLLSVGPRADGTIPEEARAALEGLGAWLALNGEAIYGTVPWLRYGEGPAGGGTGGAMNEKGGPSYTGRDVRYTCRGPYLYAICLGMPGPEVCLRLPGEFLYPQEIVCVNLLGRGEALAWRLDPDGLKVGMPDRLSSAPAVTIRIERRHPFRGGTATT